jgi:uncharacterized protein YbaR (Trm112 family)
MHLLVTDHLACPHCGPNFGLVLVADRIDSRRILDGFFGCANCQARYPVREGFGDFRTASSGGPDAEGGEGFGSPAFGEGPEGAISLAALLGLSGGSGYILLCGRAVPHAAALSQMGDGFEVFAFAPGLDDWVESEGVSRLDFGAHIPIRSRSLRGVVLAGRTGVAALSEAVRVLVHGSRAVLLDPPNGADEVMVNAGLTILAGDESALVGALK